MIRPGRLFAEVGCRWRRIVPRLTLLAEDEEGMEVPSAILLLALVSLPLILVLINFADQIVDILNEDVAKLRPGL